MNYAIIGSGMWAKRLHKRLARTDRRQAILKMAIMQKLNLARFAHA